MAVRAQDQPTAGVKSNNKSIWFARITLIVVTILILSNLIAALFVAGFQIYYDGMIYPGVNVWGIDLSGLTPEDAQTALMGQFDYPQSTVITFRDGMDIWPITAGELGVQFDVYRTVQAAYEIGRQPELFPSLQQQAQAWRKGYEIAPVIVYDQRAADLYMAEIVGVINQEKRDATVSLNGLDVISTASQVGREVDAAETLDELRDLILSLDSGEVNIVVEEDTPAIADVEAVAVALTHLVSEDLELYVDEPLPGDPGPWIAPREALANMLHIERVDKEDGTAEYQWWLDEEALTEILLPLTESLLRTAVDAKILFNEDIGTIEPIVASQDGRELNIAESVAYINERAFEPGHRVPLVFDVIRPNVPDDATGEDLGIVELVASATTYFAGSSAARRANVRTAASRFNGVVIPPGGEFSFNEHLGDVSVDTGYEEALIIYNGRTIEGVGGGVCQVSTTAFQAAFYAGFPILERWPHGYWVGYYDSGEGRGMDATVYYPLVDLRFQNDMDTYLLIETYTNLNNLTVTFRFYGTNDGRTVQKDGPYTSNVVSHGPPIYEENAALAPGTIRQVDYAVDGFDVTVYRTVYRDGEILYQDTLFSQYTPWQAVFQVAPGGGPGG